MSKLTQILWCQTRPPKEHFPKFSCSYDLWKCIISRAPATMAENAENWHLRPILNFASLYSRIFHLYRLRVPKLLGEFYLEIQNENKMRHSSHTSLLLSFAIVKTIHFLQYLKMPKKNVYKNSSILAFGWCMKSCGSVCLRLHIEN